MICCNTKEALGGAVVRLLRQEDPQNPELNKVVVEPGERAPSGGQGCTRQPGYTRLSSL